MSAGWAVAPSLVPHPAQIRRAKEQEPTPARFYAHPTGTCPA